MPPPRVSVYESRVHVRRHGGEEPKRGERRSVYETRELTWRDKLRRLVGGEKQPAPLFDPPRLVVERGRPVGYRCVDGSVLRFPEPPADPSQWPESWWGDGRGHDG